MKPANSTRPWCDWAGCQKPARAKRGGLCSMHETRRRQGRDMSAPPRFDYSYKGLACSVKDCESPARIRRLCLLHYERLRRGTDMATPPRAHRPWSYNGAICSIEDCQKPAKALGWCSMHYYRWKRHGDPSVRLPTVADLPQPIGSDHPRWQGDAIGYTAVHYRLRSQYGSPTSCTQCGADDPRLSYEWALNWRANPEVVYGNTPGLPPKPYSLDLTKYTRLCVPCHRAFDTEHATSNRGTS